MRGVKNIAVFLVWVSGLVSVALAQTSTVAAANIMGYTKVTVPSNGYAMVSYGFKTPSGESLFNAVFGTNQLTSGSRLTSCEIVYIWNSAAQSYEQYAQYDGLTYSTADWKLTPTNPVISGGVFIQAHSGDPDHTIIFSGDIVSTNFQNVSIAGNEGFDLISYPFSSEVAISNLNVTGATAGSRLTQADIIYRWVNDHYEQYALYTDGEWYNVSDWKITPTTDHIKLCEGFWYQGKTNLTWISSNRYFEAINN